MAEFEIVAKGSGTDGDVALVRAEFVHLPAEILADIANHRLKVVACRGSVVDFKPSLHDVHPDGWPAGAVWDSVPGAFLPDEKRIVVATIPAADGARRVPRRGEGHGSFSLAVHELLHGYDQVTHTPSKSTAFRDAWKTDETVIGAEPGSIYFLNEKWGPREAFAESGARRFGIDAAGAPRWPALAAYWGAVDIRSFGDIDPETTGFMADEIREEGDFIGSAFRADDGSVVMNLFAHAEGIEGHATIVVPAERSAGEGLARNLVDVRALPMSARMAENFRAPHREQWLVKAFR